MWEGIELERSYLDLNMIECSNFRYRFNRWRFINLIDNELIKNRQGKSPDERCVIINYLPIDFFHNRLFCLEKNRKIESILSLPIFVDIDSFNGKSKTKNRFCKKPRKKKK